MTASQLSPSSSHKPSILILADSKQERNKWVGLLNELLHLLKKNKLKERVVYVPKEAYDSTLPLIKTTQSAAIIGQGSPLSACHTGSGGSSGGVRLEVRIPGVWERKREPFHTEQSHLHILSCY